MIEDEIRKRITRRGDPVSSDIFHWDPGSSTIVVDGMNYIFDFRGLTGFNFVAQNGCTFITGPYCGFKVGKLCTINSSNSCSIRAGSHSWIHTGSFSIIRTEERSSIIIASRTVIRIRGFSEIFYPREEKVLTINKRETKILRSSSL